MQKYESKINTGDSAQEIAAWIAERKARYPTAATQAKRDAQRLEQAERGELVCDAKLSAADEARQRHNRQFERGGATRGRGGGASIGARGSQRGRGRGGKDVRASIPDQSNLGEANATTQSTDELMIASTQESNKPDAATTVESTTATVPSVESASATTTTTATSAQSTTQASATESALEAPRNESATPHEAADSTSATTATVNGDKQSEAATASTSDGGPLATTASTPTIALPEVESAPPSTQPQPVDDDDAAVTPELTNNAQDTVDDAAANSDSDSAPLVAPLKCVPENYALQMDLKHNFNAARMQAREEQLVKKQEKAESHHQQQTQVAQRQAVERAPPVCRDWMLNACARGDECTFAHSETSISAQLVRQQIQDQRQANSSNRGNSSARGSKRGGGFVRGGRGGSSNRRQPESFSASMDPLSRLYLPKPSDYILRDLIAPQVHQEKSELLAAFRFIRQHNFMQPQKQKQQPPIEAESTPQDLELPSCASSPHAAHETKLDQTSTAASTAASTSPSASHNENSSVPIDSVAAPTVNAASASASTASASLVRLPHSRR